MINKVIIHNYKLFEDFELEFDKELSIIVGDNETGKSTILEAINLALTKRLNGRFIENEMSPFLFNNKVVNTYLTDLKAGKKTPPPEIFIEVFLDNIPDLTSFRGTNNSRHEDAIGIKLEIVFNDDYKEEYEQFITAPDILPIEYYKINWMGFDGNQKTPRGIPIKPSFIDATAIRLQSGADYYLQSIINEGLDPKQRAELTIAYRKLKDTFSDHESIKAINKNIDDKKGTITDKELSIGLDVSQKTNWEASLVPHLDNIPSHFSGKGEQNSLKIMIALKRKAEDTNVILMEEPENHLSFTSMNKLLTKIQEECKGKQIIIATHSSFILNKLGLERLIFIHNLKKAYLKNLDKDTQDYFKKLSGYDTLRLILAKKAILVEGPSDELIVQKAYLKKNDKLPIDDGIDVINVRGLSFKRFLDIAKELNINTSVITDNDGDYENNIKNEYKNYEKNPSINIYADNDNNAGTLEPQILKYNSVEILNRIFGTTYDKDDLLKFMKNNKTEVALRLFQTEKDFTMPKYIEDGIL